MFETLERGGEVRGRVASDVKQRTLEPIVRATVKEGVTVSTNEPKSYKDLLRFGYEHGKVGDRARQGSNLQPSDS